MIEKEDIGEGEEGHGDAEALRLAEEAYVAELLLKERLAEQERMLNEGGSK